MKKSLVLAMAMALGVTASAYAANPFSDVPAGHWAYDSIAELSAAGVVDGYEDGTFGGDKLMTRYEMAQITARAMANGADVDALAAEFAEELDSLGVRVANLENKVDNVKITGAIRARYIETDNGSYKADLRTRLWVNGAINDNWTYTGLLQNVRNITDDKNSEDDDELDLTRAYLNGRVGGLDVQAGRWDEVTGIGSVMDAHLDGIKVAYGDKVRVSALAAKATDALSPDEETTLLDKDDRIYAFGAETEIGVFDVYANYVKADAKVAHDKEIYNVGLAADLAKNLELSYDYSWGDEKVESTVSKDGFIVGLNYKGAGEEVGSFGLHANYYDQPINAYLLPTFDMPRFADGYEGWSVGADYTVAKNIQLSVNYYDSEAKKLASDDQAIYSELNFFF